MMSLSEFRRKRALQLNAIIDKRCSRKLEQGLGWSDQTEVYEFTIFINLLGGIFRSTLGRISLFQKSCCSGIANGGYRN